MQKIEEIKKEFKDKIIEYLSAPSSTPPPPSCQSPSVAVLNCNTSIAGISFPSMVAGNGPNQYCANPIATATWKCK